MKNVNPSTLWKPLPDRTTVFITSIGMFFHALHSTPQLTLYRFVDRDMFMRYLGGGVGHKGGGAQKIFQGSTDLHWKDDANDDNNDSDTSDDDSEGNGPALDNTHNVQDAEKKGSSGGLDGDYDAGGYSTEDEGSGEEEMGGKSDSSDSASGMDDGDYNEYEI